jgi:nucleotide-binding universal stress UspA family protein
MGTGRIVVGVDGSEASREALLWARSQADAVGAELVAVTAWSDPNAGYPSLSSTVPLRVPIDVGRERRAELEAFVRDVLGDRAVVSRAVRGHAADVLLEAGRGAGLVVVGTRGRRELVGALLGSVSQRVLTHAPCPVVVVPHVVGGPHDEHRGTLGHFREATPQTIM